MDILVAVRELYGATHRFDQRAAKALGLHPSDLRCVNALESGPRSPSDLAAELGLSRGAMTALLDRLEAAQLIERVPDPDDRRRYAVQLRQSFYRRAARVYGELGKSIGAAYPSPKQAAQVANALRQLCEAFDASLRE
ncbi:hypothetical protein F183_A03450 [Bryobacterales bacterium F-183]|nr:hypothetical protein F183_A03450 [Bryobacterales bacterium F-183]